VSQHQSNGRLPPIPAILARSDPGEASLEHLIDWNPYSSSLIQHLAILRAARAADVDTVRHQFLAELDADLISQTLDGWIATPTWEASAEYLATHADQLLTDPAAESNP
jgi:hypothetical protein